MAGFQRDLIPAQTPEAVGGVRPRALRTGDLRALQQSVGNQSLAALTREGSGPQTQDRGRTNLSRWGSEGFVRRAERGSDADSKISASGAVSIKYAPEAVDKSTMIVFIQVVRDLNDGVAVKPSAVSPIITYKDATTTADLYTVDYLGGEKDPYYNGDDAADSGTQGNAVSKPPVDAAMTDNPFLADAEFPTGVTKIRWEFTTASFSAAGADKGTFYDHVAWAYEKEKGKGGKVAVGSRGVGKPAKQFTDAVALFASKKGFKMP